MFVFFSFVGIIIITILFSILFSQGDPSFLEKVILPGIVTGVFLVLLAVMVPIKTTYYTEEYYDIDSWVEDNPVDRTFNIYRSYAKVETSGDYYLEYQQYLIGNSELIQYILEDDIIDIDSAADSFGQYRKRNE